VTSEEEVLRRLVSSVRPRGEEEVQLWEAEDVQSWARGHSALAHLVGALARAEVTGEDLAAATANWATEHVGLHDEADI